MNTKRLPTTLLFLSLAFFQLTAQTLNSGLIGHYPCTQEDASKMILEDISLWKNHGTLYGNIEPEFDNKRPDQEILGAGQNACLFINEDYDHGKFDDLQTFSMSFWFMEITNSNLCVDDCTSLMNMEDEEGNRYNLFFKRHRELFLTNKSDGITLFTVESERYRRNPPRQWNHIAFTIDAVSQFAEIYVNGRLTGRVDNRVMFVPKQPRIGFGLDHDGQYFVERFCIDDIRLYDRVLAAREIAELAGNPLSNTSSPVVDDNKLQLYPNPSTSHEIQWEGIQLSDVARLQVMDFSGRVILSVDKPTDNRLQLPAQASGNLLLHVIQKDGLRHSRTFLQLK